jgi:hypothetical protein
MEYLKQRMSASTNHRSPGLAVDLIDSARLERRFGFPRNKRSPSQESPQ